MIDRSTSLNWKRRIAVMVILIILLPLGGGTVIADHTTTESAQVQLPLLQSGDPPPTASSAASPAGPTDNGTSTDEHSHNKSEPTNATDTIGRLSNSSSGARTLSHGDPGRLTSDWEKELDTTLSTSSLLGESEGLEIATFPDGDYALLGRHNNLEELYIARVNADASVEWVTTLRAYQGYGGIATTPGGDVIAVIEHSGTAPQMYRLSGEGEIVYRKSTAESVALEEMTIRDESVYIVGERGANPHLEKRSLADGGLVDVELPTPRDGRFKDIVQTDAGFVAVGVVNGVQGDTAYAVGFEDDPFSNGTDTIRWETSFGANDANREELVRAVKAPGGDVVALGEADESEDSGGTDNLLARFDESDGDLVWRDRFGSAADDLSLDLFRAGDRVIALTYPGFDAPDDGRLAKASRVDPADGSREIVIEGHNEGDVFQAGVGVGRDRFVITAAESPAASGAEFESLETGLLRLRSTDDSDRSVDADGTTVYVGASGDDDVGLYAVNTTTGEQEWTYSKATTIHSSPTVVNGTLYVGAGNQSSHRVVAIDAATGKTEWTFTEPSGFVFSSPTVVENTVYVGADDSTLYAIDAKTGDRKWSYEAPNGSINPSPQVVQGTVYIGAGGSLQQDDSTVYAVDADTGTEEWRFTAPSDSIISSALVVNGTLYIGSGKPEAAPEDTTLYAVDAATGDQKWAFREPELAIVSSPTVVDGTVYVGTGGEFQDAGGSLFAVDAETGEREWRFTDPEGPVASSPTVWENTVYVGSVSRESDPDTAAIWAVDAATGQREWVNTAPSEGVFSSPTVYDGVVYVGTTGASLYALDATTGEQEWVFDDPDAPLFSSPTVVTDPLKGGSVGTRVTSGILGHHGEWADIATDGEDTRDSNPDELQGESDLSVTATDADGSVVEDAEIILYNESFTPLDRKVTDENGDVSWSTLVPGEYNVELYGTGGAFWGGTVVTVDARGASTTVQRTAPRLSTIVLSGDDNGEGGYYGGRPINISPEVRNDGAQRPVRVQIRVDTDNDGAADRNVTRGGLGTPIPSGEIGYYGYDYDPSTNGTKQVRVVTEAYINDGWVLTDNTGWTKIFEVENNIVGYDPKSSEYNNITTAQNSRTHSSAFPSQPNKTSAPEISPPHNGDKKNITSTDEYPWSAVGTLANGGLNTPLPIGFCTATLVDDRHVLTAGHCMYEGGNWNSNIDSLVFTPGQNHDDIPFDSFNVTYVQVYKKWVESENRTVDMAILTINESISSQTGTFGYEAHPKDAQTYGSGSTPLDKEPSQITGYPSSFEADYVERISDQWNIIAKGEGTSVEEGLGDLEFCPETRLCHDYATGGALNELTAGGLSGAPVWQVNSEDKISIISVHVATSADYSIDRSRVPDYVPEEALDFSKSVGEFVADAVADGVGVRISEKKYGDIGQMIDHGYEQIPTERPGLDTPRPPEGDKSGAATGDPHLTTFDGVAYDFQAAGEFVLTRDSDGTPHVQARLRPVADRDVSVVSAVATELDGQNVTIDARDEEMLTVDGTTRSLSTDESLSVGDGEIFRTGETYIVVYPGADGDVDNGDSRLEATVAGDRLDVVVKPNRSAVDSMSGLLGSPDGNTANDLVLADGTRLSKRPSFEELYGQYREDWRVTADTSLFEYDDGESPRGFYDPGYPSKMVTVDDLPATDRKRAIEVAQNAGLEPGTAHFRDAVLDYALTEDRSYVASAAMATDETDVTDDATPAETALTEPTLTVEAKRVVTETQPFTVSVEADHPEPNTVTVLIANGSETIFEETVPEAFDSEQTLSWNTTVDGTPVADGTYTLSVVATSATGVRNVTTRGILVDNTPPSLTVESPEMGLDPSVDTATVTFSYNDTASGIDPSSVVVLENGTDVTGAAQFNESGGRYDLTGLGPGDVRTIEVRVADNVGLETSRTVTVTVSPGETDDGLIATRDIATRTVPAGESTTVTVTASTATATDDLRYTETFDSSLNVSVVDDDDATISEVADDQLAVSWGGVSEMTLVYEVAVPENVTEGTTYDLTGTVEDRDAGTEVTVDGDTTIEVGERDPVAAYTDENGIVDSQGLLDAAADFRDGEIGPQTLLDVAAAFRSGNPVI